MAALLLCHCWWSCRVLYFLGTRWPYRVHLHGARKALFKAQDVPECFGAPARTDVLRIMDEHTVSQVAAALRLERSLFERIQAAAPACVKLLSVQYRMHPMIRQFPSQVGPA